MSIQPLRDFVLVVKEKTDEKTPGGLLYRPDTVEEKIIRATVVAIGSGRVTLDGSVVPMEVAVGDRVVFNKSLATELTDGEEKVLILREDQLLCIMK